MFRRHGRWRSDWGDYDEKRRRHVQRLRDAVHQPGDPEGTIKSHLLEGELGDVKAGVPGLRLFSEATGRGGEFAAAECFGGAVGLKVRGSVIGQLSGASGNAVSEGKSSTSHSLKFVRMNGIQKFTQFVGEEAMEQLEKPKPVKVPTRNPA
jgi:hypothetical protein